MYALYVLQSKTDEKQPIMFSSQKSNIIISDNDNANQYIC